MENNNIPYFTNKMDEKEESDSSESFDFESQLLKDAIAGKETE